MFGYFLALITCSTIRRFVQYPGSFEDKSGTKSEDLALLNGISTQNGISITENNDGELILSDNFVNSGRTIGKVICIFIMVIHGFQRRGISLLSWLIFRSNSNLCTQLNETLKFKYARRKVIDCEPQLALLKVPDDKK